MVFRWFCWNWKYRSLDETNEEALLLLLPPEILKFIASFLNVRSLDIFTQTNKVSLFSFSFFFFFSFALMYPHTPFRKKYLRVVLSDNALWFSKFREVSLENFFFFSFLLIELSITFQLFPHSNFELYQDLAERMGWKFVVIRKLFHRYSGSQLRT